MFIRALAITLLLTSSAFANEIKTARDEHLDRDRTPPRDPNLERGIDRMRESSYCRPVTIVGSGIIGGAGGAIAGIAGNMVGAFCK
jgi:hypothetical protein